MFHSPEEQPVAHLAYEVMRRLENQPQKLPSVPYLQKPEIQAMVSDRLSVIYLIVYANRRTSNSRKYNAMANGIR